MGFLLVSAFSSWLISGDEYDRFSLDCSLSFSLSVSAASVGLALAMLAGTCDTLTSGG